MSADLTSSMLLGVNTVGYLRRLGVEAEFPEGEIIIQRGQEGRAFYVVLMGEVELQLRHGDGTHLPLGRLRAGATFGELSALRRTPAIADVVARTPVRLLVYPAEHLSEAMGECEPLRRKVMAGLAHNLHKATASTWALFKHAKVLSSRQDSTGTSEIVGASARIRRVRRQIDCLCESDEPVLVVGGPGTGKLLVARVIHQGSQRADGPLIVVDCCQLPPGGAIEPMLGSALRAASDQVEGLGAIHLAHGGTLILHNLDGLEAQDQQLLVRYPELHQDEGPAFPDFRLVATARDSERLTEPLRALLGQEIELPRLAQRRRDILPLARHFLQEIGTGKTLGTSAEHALLSRTYQQRNIAELREVVELAEHCADGPELRAEHIFSGFSHDVGSLGWKIPGQERLKQLIRGGWLTALRGLVFVGFLAAIGLCLVAGKDQIGRVANGLIWSVWEPVIFALFLLVGSVWCAVCPLSIAGRLVKRLIAFNRPAPTWSRTHGPWLAALGFLLIVWIELRFSAVANPFASGLLLLGLIAASVLCCCIYQREIWCRDLCPLGRLAEVLAPAAPLALAARRSICFSSCTTHECFKGRGRLPGCTVHHHPQQVNEAHRCKMCLDCLTICPHDSVGLYLRPPLLGVIKLDSTANRLIPFATGVLVLTVVMLASQAVKWQPLNLTAAALPGLLAGMLFGLALTMVLKRREDYQPAAPRLTLALMVLGWGVLMAYQLDHLPGLSALNLTIVPGSWEESYFPATISLAIIGKLCLVLGAALATAVTILGACKHSANEGRKIGPVAWLLAVAVGLFVVSAALVSVL